MGFVTHVGVFFFNLLFILCTLPVFFVAKVCVLCEAIRPMRPGCLREQAVLIFTCLMWRLTVLCSFWVRLDIDGLAEFRSGLGASGRPAVIVANHASFMDTILLVTFMPLSKMAHIKMFVSGHLLKMPILGTIVKAMGHKAVPFKASGADGGMELDKEVMEQRQKELELHVASGGIAGWFPEGTMNREDVRVVQRFRAGGFTLAVHVDVEIWCVAFHGNTTCWPRTAPLGGRPAKIGAKFVQLCDSSHSHVKRAEVEIGDEREASILLANKAMEAVQSGVTSLCT
eukprot:CAMPEP_0204591222 /NCGR_PEP_ID=MMETSP0661-20131031/50238_1 /ASSEMBLY_ACC=CAM_ASM_000606 /TAXON_ID=109239 /ORGANISM="Alexandrium margalefi, Strain AMGDE01CS-322" /LENGTH=284 /DNA_ID=CAMNT_0051601327 /DNA_START=57 /DNA_END=911 /DNA_ORIENTATION=-